MTAGTIDEKKIEAAVRRLQVLPERKGEVSRAVTGLLYVIRKAAATDAEAAEAPPVEAPKPAEPEPIDTGRLAAAKELREAQWLFHDLKEAWDELSSDARGALDGKLRAAKLSKSEPDELIERFVQLADIMAAVADALEQPDPPAPEPEPDPAPKPEDPTLVIAQHALHMYTRLTGKSLPKPKGKDGKIPRGPFYWLLEDVFAGSGILASADQYTKIVAQS